MSNPKDCGTTGCDGDVGTVAAAERPDLVERSFQTRSWTSAIQIHSALRTFQSPYWISIELEVEQ